MMKIFRQIYSRVTLAILLSVFSLLSFAQDKGIDVDIDIKKESEWYQQPWVWVVGAAVFILLLVALLRSGAAKRQ